MTLNYKWMGGWCVALLAMLLAGCQQPVQNVAIPSPQDQAAYQPVPYQKPLPPGAFGQTGGNPYGEHVPLPDEAAYVQAYQTQREPRIMVEVLRLPTSTTNRQISASSADFDAIEISMIDYLNANGQVDIQSESMARDVLSRESFLRLQNGDPRVLPLLKHQLKTDVLIEIKAAPTGQSSTGQPAIRMLATAVSTTDARILGAAYVDMPLPMSKTNINMYTGYLADKIMQKLASVWGGSATAYNPIIVRIYNAAGIDDLLALKHFVAKVPGVRLVVNRGMTGSSSTAYGRLAVQYDGSPGRFYESLKRNIGVSTGIKAFDLQNNTVDLEVTGPMVLKTVTVKTKTTTVRTRTQERVIQEQPINPAGSQ
ncbi:MAG: hypothetical protein ACP5O1_10980 [Phycisphaerae bacterium]